MSPAANYREELVTGRQRKCQHHKPGCEGDACRYLSRTNDATEGTPAEFRIKTM
jgi:hypothetical protein